MTVFNSFPTDKEPLTLFEFSVRKVIQLGMMDISNNHQTWANLIFSYERQAFVRSEMMSIVKREYSKYFNEELQYRFLKDKIKTNFPYLFGMTQKQGLFVRMNQALEAECTEQNDPRNKITYRVSSFDSISAHNNLYIYRVTLFVEEGEDPHFSDGMPIEFRTSETIYSCEVVEYDYVNAHLFISSSRPIIMMPDARVVSDASFNIIALKNRLQEISTEEIEPSKPLFKFLNNSTSNLKTIGYSEYPSYLDDLLKNDRSQQEAFQAALSNDITFIWGPPGTGKSYTLAAIIMALYYMKGERTVVCCLSNVAVDQLVNKVVDIIEINEPEMQRGEFYRAGRTQDTKLIATDFLFPDDATSRNLRLKIKMLNGRIDKFKETYSQYSDEAIRLKAIRKDAREELKCHTDYLISQVKVVFSTISNFVINAKLKDGIFDNLIVDEASMLSEPQLIALASRVTKRIILVGDFQQLSPITIAGIPILKNSVFKLCGIDINSISHPALHQLLNQRRSNPKIVDVINHTFYSDRLIAENNKNHHVVAIRPYSSCVIGLKCVAEGAVRFTKGGTRQNMANANAVLELLDMYSRDDEETFSIGVITPYSGQVSLIKGLFFEKTYSLNFQDRVRIGTVHTFQGSECDVIIFDMVDCSKFEKGKKSYFGKIYAGEQGEQLLNVAISRARHKLIVVCEPEYLRDCPGGVISDKSFGIFQKFLMASRKE